MARYAVYKNPDAIHSKIAPYLLDLQNTYIQSLDTVIVVPMIRQNMLPHPLEAINPLIAFQSQKYYLDLGNLAPVPRSMLRSVIDNISAQQLDIQNALDHLFGGY